MKKDLRPEGDCFVVAFDYARSAYGKLIESQTQVVHGSVFSTWFNKRIQHAWVEIGGVIVFDSTINFLGPKKDYYSFAKAIADNKYGCEETLMIAVRTKHYGPWTKAEREGKK